MKLRMTPAECQRFADIFFRLLQEKGIGDLRSIHDYPYHPADVAKCIQIAAIAIDSAGLKLHDPQDSCVLFCEVSA